ncbi:MAG: ATP-binding protein [Bryobacteraceae bacterium]
MSLKSRLRISIVTLVTLLVIAQSVVSLRFAAEDKFTDSLDRSQAIAEQVRHTVLQRVNEQARSVEEPPATMDQMRLLWYRLIEDDVALPDLLIKTAANASAVIEIMVCDDAGVILASSLPKRQRLTYESLPDLSIWQKRPLWDRLADVLFRSQAKDYAIVQPIGVIGQQRPILNIRVVVSSVLVRRAILPHVETLAAVSLLSLLASIILAYLFTNVLLRSLDRLSRQIESIATGKYIPPATPVSARGEAKEFVDIQSKLDVLNQQFRGAREDMVQLRGNIDRMLQRLEEGFLLFDPEGRLMRASRSVERLLAESPDHLQGHTVSELFPDSTPLGELVASAIAGKQSVRDAQITVQRGDAGPVRLLVNVEALEGFPEPGSTSTLLTLRDAESRREIRSQLDISTRLAAISRLTGGVAHEIKNPLNAMALHLEILKGKLNGDARVERELSVIGGEIARLDRVVKTFLDFTRPVDLELKDLDMVEVARQVAALVWPDAERCGVSVEFNAGNASAYIRADEDLIKQALLNVVNNGIEAMKKGGRLRLTVEPSAETVLVTVTDEGSGIPPEVREKIFNLYFTTKEKGSGIGLAMTYRIVQLHNATMDFTSTPGAGTTFRMRFPAAEPDLSKPPSGRAAASTVTVHPRSTGVPALASEGSKK